MSCFVLHVVLWSLLLYYTTSCYTFVTQFKLKLVFDPFLTITNMLNKSLTVQSTRNNLKLSITAHDHNSGARQPWCSSARPRLLFVQNSALNGRVHTSADGPVAADEEEERRVNKRRRRRKSLSHMYKCKVFPFHLQCLLCHFSSVAPGARMRLSFKSSLMILMRCNGRRREWRKKKRQQKQKQETEPRQETKRKDHLSRPFPRHPHFFPFVILVFSHV